MTRKSDIIKFRDKINFSKGIYINPKRKNSIWKQKIEKGEILEKVIESYKPLGAPGVHYSNENY